MVLPDYDGVGIYDLVKDVMCDTQYWGIVNCNKKCVLKYVPISEECNEVIIDGLVEIFGAGVTIELMEWCYPFDYFYDGSAQVLFKNQDM